jgi:hypothetical protein
MMFEGNEFEELIKYSNPYKETPNERRLHLIGLQTRQTVHGEAPLNAPRFLGRSRSRTRPPARALQPLCRQLAGKLAKHRRRERSKVAKNVGKHG